MSETPLYPRLPPNSPSRVEMTNGSASALSPPFLHSHVLPAQSAGREDGRPLAPLRCLRLQTLTPPRHVTQGIRQTRARMSTAVSNRATTTTDTHMVEMKSDQDVNSPARREERAEETEERNKKTGGREWVCALGGAWLCTREPIAGAEVSRPRPHIPSGAVALTQVPVTVGEARGSAAPIK
ncbi:hypothetical protein AAFF_G00222560 [Aldrovandia affinis]|uniref:Uncharacterized protein n=1 Tax=Aldrovandia affinis TaxID=143900 RepID=A0AAD7RFA1_9TELE|nr:hypothetical protein AAFF_G00222560 [Aldrovandia affinis]